MISLEGKRIVVTGAAGGIGGKVAEAIVAVKGDLVLADLNGAKAEQVARPLRARGATVDVLHMDVTDMESVRRFAAEVRHTGPAIDGIVNSAGVSFGERLEDLDFLEKWRISFKVNVDGPAFVILGLLDQLKETRGAVVNIASTCAFQVGNCPTAYTPSKGAVKLMTQSFARDLAPYGIRVNAVAPALVATEMSVAQRADEEKMRNFNLRSMLKRPAEAEEIAGPIVVLLSSVASYMTGVTIPIDGGILG